MSAPWQPSPPPTDGAFAVVESDRAVIAVGESLQGGDNEAKPERGVEVVRAAMQPSNEQSVRSFKASAIPGLLDELFDRSITLVRWARSIAASATAETRSEVTSAAFGQVGAMP